MREDIEIRQQIKDLWKKMKTIPVEVKRSEMEEWKSFCQGGISALYWVLEETNPYIKRQGELDKKQGGGNG